MEQTLHLAAHYIALVLVLQILGAVLGVLQVGLAVEMSLRALYQMKLLHG
jgi:hypothetical protein